MHHLVKIRHHLFKSAPLGLLIVSLAGCQLVGDKTRQTVETESNSTAVDSDGVQQPTLVEEDMRVENPQFKLFGSTLGIRLPAGISENQQLLNVASDKIAIYGSAEQPQAVIVLLQPKVTAKMPIPFVSQIVDGKVKASAAALLGAEKKNVVINGRSFERIDSVSTINKQKMQITFISGELTPTEWISIQIADPDPEQQTALVTALLDTLKDEQEVKIEHK